MSLESISFILSTYWVFLLIALVIGIITGWLASGANSSS